MMEHGLRIGQVCRLYGITADTLRHYERKGLIKPYKDPANGYRYYSVAQLDVIDCILTGRALGIPLAEMGRVIEAENVDGYREMYALQQRLLAEEIARLTALQRVSALRLAELEALAAHGAGSERSSIDEGLVLYLFDVATLFALEAEPEAHIGLEQLFTWRIFGCDEAGAVYEEEDWCGFSFAPGEEMTPLEENFCQLAGERVPAALEIASRPRRKPRMAETEKIRRLVIPAGTAKESFWGEDAALLAHLQQQVGSRERRFFVQVRYSLLHGDGEHEHFVDIFVTEGERFC